MTRQQCALRKHSITSLDAYKRAYAELKLRDWVMLSKTRNDECNVKLKAADIPHLHKHGNGSESYSTNRSQPEIKEETSVGLKFSCMIS